MSSSYRGAGRAGAWVMPQQPHTSCVSECYSISSFTHVHAASLVCRVQGLSLNEGPFKGSRTGHSQSVSAVAHLESKLPHSSPYGNNLRNFLLLHLSFLPQLRCCAAVKPLVGIQLSFFHLWGPQWENCSSMRVRARIGSSGTPVKSRPVKGCTEPSATASLCGRSPI